LGLIPEDKIAEIRDRTDIVAVIGDYVQLKRAGNSWKGLCPFHNEKTPSFNVIPAKQFFHCFGCGKTGDVFAFIGELEGKGFVEVARDLAKRSGVDLPEPPRSREAQEAAARAESERAKMLRLNELTAHFYRSCFDSEAGEKVRAYVEKRGIGPKTQETFRVGWAPPGWESLTAHLEHKKVPHELAERAGLIKPRERGPKPQPGAPPTTKTHYDVFVDRVVYALTSPMGEVIGFGGRLTEAKEDQPKYKNSPETILYKKGDNLFGLHAAKHGIRKTGRALVVEGNFDVMTLHEKGVDYTVAPQGTAITEAQVGLLKRFARDVVLMLDADPAGRAATMKVIRLFVDADLKARIAQLRAQDGKKVDPDDLARNDLPRLQKLIDNAVDALEFYFDQVASTSEPTVPGKVRAIEECAPLLRGMRDPLARDLYVDRLAALLKVDPGLIRKTLRGGPTPQPAQSALRASEPPPVAPTAAPPRKISPVNAQLLSLLAQHGALIAQVTDDTVAKIADGAVRSLLESARQKGAFVPQALLESAAPEIRDAVAHAFMSDAFASCDAQAVLRNLMTEITLPTDKASLEKARQEALRAGNRELFETITKRIVSTRIQGETSR
jgi:DNA primase